MRAYLVPGIVVGTWEPNIPQTLSLWILHENKYQPNYSTNNKDSSLHCDACCGQGFKNIPQQVLTWLEWQQGKLPCGWGQKGKINWLAEKTAQKGGKRFRDRHRQKGEGNVGKHAGKHSKENGKPRTLRKGIAWLDLLCSLNFSCCYLGTKCYLERVL